MARPERRFRISRSTQHAVLAAVALVTIALVGSAIAAHSQPREVSTSQPRYTEAPKPPITRPWVDAYMIGDSITGGAGAGGGAFAPGAQLARAMNWGIVTDGIGGSGFVAFGRLLDPNVSEDRSLSTRLDEIIAADPDVVIVAAGRNDITEDLGIVGARVSSFYTDLHAQLPDATIITISPWLWDLPQETDAVEPIRVISAQLRAASEAVGAVYIDSETELWRITVENSAQMMSSDGWHPNQDGYVALGRSMARTFFTHGVPRGPERWQSVSPLSDEWYDPTDAVFEPES